MGSFRRGGIRVAWHVAIAFAVVLFASAARARSTPTARVHADVFEDPSGRLAYDDVRAGAAFRPVEPSRANIGYSSSAFWLRVVVETDADEPTTWLLEPARPPDYAELHGEGQPLRRAGIAIPAAERDVRARTVAFRLDLPAHARRTLFLRIASNDTMDLGLKLTEAEVFADRERVENFLAGAYYGLVVGIVLYNFFLFVSTRDRSYILYVVFQSSLVLAQASLDRFAWLYLWSGWWWFAQRSDEVLGSFVIFTAIRFTMAFLETRARWPRLHRALSVVGVGAVALSFAALVKDNDVVKLGMAGCFLVAVALLLVTGAIGVRQRVPNAPFFLAAWSLFLLGAITHVLSAIGVLQIPGAMSLGGFKLGSAAEATLLSLGLGNRIRLLRASAAHAKELAGTLAELRTAQDLLVRQERLATLGRIAAGVGHEVGNPLNFVSGGAAELDKHLASLEAHPDDASALADARRALRLVASGSDRIKKVVANFRRYVTSRDVAPAPANLVAELSETLDLTADLCARCGVTVVRDLEPLPSVLARAGEIEQVFMNIVLNACHAMSAGGQLAVSTKALASSVEIRFTDDGPGVPASRRATIFDPFVRDEVGSGTGLGLFVSREIVARHGGELRLEEAAVGATFVVTLPRVPVS